MCYTYVLATYYIYSYLHDISITLYPSHRGGGSKVDPGWIIYMLATYDLLTALHTSCASDTLPHRGGGGKVDPTSIIYMLAASKMSTISDSVNTGP